MDRNAELCWGQRYVWLNHHQLPPSQRHELNFTISIGPAAGSTITSIRQALDLLVRRHEGLRTTYHTDAGPDPVQRVHAPRPLPVECFDTREYPPAELTKLINEFTSAGFVLDEEWPIRACLVCTGPEPKRLVLVGHHIALDDWTLEALKREADELHASILARRPAGLAPVRYHPVDLARFEASAEAAATHERCREHWERGLLRIPADQFARRRSTGPGQAGGLSASFSSPAALTAARNLAARYRVFPSAVYGATFAALLAAHTGSATVAYRAFAGNREAPPHAEVLTCVFQPTLVDVACGDNPTFAEVVRRTAGQAATATENSYCAYDQIVATVAQVSTERGLGVRVATTFNQLRYPTKVRGGSRSIFTWNPTPHSWSYLDEDCYLRVSEWRDCLVLTLNAHDSVLDAVAVERFMRGFETVLTTAADGNDTIRVDALAELVGFDRAPAADAAVVVDHSLVDPGRVAAVLSEHPGVAVARVFADQGGQRLTAYVVAVEADLAPATLRTYLLERMYDGGGIACPHRFVMCDEPLIDSPDAWAAMPVREAGNGRQTPDLAPADPAQRALADAVRAVNQLDRLSLAQSYVQAGGRIANIPRLQQVIRAQGFDGPSVYEIASARPLRAVAAMLTPVARLGDDGTTRHHLEGTSDVHEHTRS